MRHDFPVKLLLQTRKFNVSNLNLLSRFFKGSYYYIYGSLDLLDFSLDLLCEGELELDGGGGLLLGGEEEGGAGG